MYNAALTVARKSLQESVTRLFVLCTDLRSTFSDLSESLYQLFQDCCLQANCISSALAATPVCNSTPFQHWCNAQTQGCSTMAITFTLLLAPLIPGIFSDYSLLPI
eukprot:gnl/MRDRNA2_/MRDRNA2_57525_c0_seq1.p1 gnl/MRDRNA2_/MRDRNA2_57525_c0~~gnl/MRDRNA2_/MRDRNA2_57525_c0_seq1.p1  ORF type:complete len:106 (+),score=2.37 gnl/MRDRNA2_/MRDRNA2_57525_c0_seq1:63-380(+)